MTRDIKQHIKISKIAKSKYKTDNRYINVCHINLANYRVVGIKEANKTHD